MPDPTLDAYLTAFNAMEAARVEYQGAVQRRDQASTTLRRLNPGERALRERELNERIATLEQQYRVAESAYNQAQAAHAALSMPGIKKLMRLLLRPRP